MALAVELYLLLADLERAHEAAAPTSAPIAELVSRQNSVKTQNEGELIWDETRSKQTLYRRQSLLTLEGSRAEIAFLDGTGLIVDEKSLIVLEKTPSDDSLGYQRITIKLLRGTLRKAAPRRVSDLSRRLGSNTPTMEIDTGDARVQLTPASELTLSTGSPEGTRLVVQSGEVRVESSQGSVAVRAGEQATLPKGGAKPDINKMPFTLLSPKAGQPIEAQGSEQAVRFRWNAARDAIAGHPQDLQISRDPEFASGLHGTRVPAAEPPLEYVELNVTLPVTGQATQWYWRVRTAGQSGVQAVSLAESFWLRPPLAPTLRYPADQARVPAMGSIEMAWELFEGASGYELEVEGRAPIVTQQAFARVEQLAAGKPSWRVRARLSDGSVSPWSAGRTLVVEEPQKTPEVVATPTPSETVVPPAAKPTEDAPPPPPDELDEPEIRKAPAKPRKPKHSSWWDALWIASAYADEAPHPEEPESWSVHLKWKPVPGVSRYKVQVSRDSKFTKVISEGEATQAEWDWEFRLGMQNSKGRAFYRVASVSAKGAVGGFSKPKPIQIPREILNAEAKPLPPQPALVVEPPSPIGPQSKATAKIAQKPVAPAKPVAQPAIKATSTQTAAPISKPRPWRIDTGLALSTGVGGLSQSSGASDLTSVALSAPFLQQKISVSLELAQTQGEALAGRVEFELGMMGFKGVDNAAQTAFKAYPWRVGAWIGPNSAKNAVTFYFGATLDRSFRWVKNGSQAVDSSGALSLGPSVVAMRNYHYTGGSFFSVRQAGLGLELPLTGVLTGGQLGIRARVWGEWNLVSVLQNSIALALRVEAEGTYLRWSAPASTGLLGWSCWLAPALRF